MRGSVQLHRSHAQEASPAAEVQFARLRQGKKESVGNERHSQDQRVGLQQQDTGHPTVAGVGLINASKQS